MEQAATRLYINRIAELDWLIALEFGRVDDAQPPENWRGVSDAFGFLHDAPGGRVLGFKVLGFSEFQGDSADVAEIWEGPLFDAPALGLSGVTPGEVVLAAQGTLGERSTINRLFFEEATRYPPKTALGAWRLCLQTGDSMAHFGLGYTLYELQCFKEAYAHLRHYTEIAPNGAWNWCWYGKAAEKVGEVAEARHAYERALELELEGDEETDAGELLDRLR